MTILFQLTIMINKILESKSCKIVSGQLSKSSELSGGLFCHFLQFLQKVCLWIAQKHNPYLPVCFQYFFIYFLQKDVDSARLYKWAHCALTQEPLQKPVVACELVCHKSTYIINTRSLRL